MNQFPQVLADEQDASVSFDSTPMFLQDMFGYSIQAIITGTTLVGSLKLEGSDDPTTNRVQVLNDDGVVNWNNISGSSQAVTGSGQVTWNVSWPNYRWVRVSYVATSGTGTITIDANAKGF